MLTRLKQEYDNFVFDPRFSEILAGSIWALSARVLATGLGLLTTVIVARFYGADVVGIVAVLNSFLLLGTIFTLLGTNTSILRLIPEHLVKYSATSAYEVYRKTQYIVIGVSLFLGVFAFLGGNLIADKVFSKPHLAAFFSLAAVFLLFKSLLLLNTDAVRGLRLIRCFALMQILPQGCNLILLIAFGAIVSGSSGPVYALLGSYALAGTVGLVIMQWAFRTRLQRGDTLKPMSFREILSLSLPMLMTSGMVFVIGQTGVIILGMFRSDAEVGYYAVAVKLATLTAFVLRAVNSMAGPKFSELFQSDKVEELFHVAKKSAKLIFWATVPILLGLLVFGRLVLRVAFGEAFVVAYPALVLLVSGQFVNAASGATGLFMNMTGNQGVLRNIMLLTAMANVGMNLLLIPPLGIYGAAAAGMVSLCTWNIIALVYIKWKYGQTTGYLPLATSMARKS